MAKSKVFKQARGKNRSPTSTNIEITLPSAVRVELVQGNELRHYEIFFSLASLTSSIAVGFWTGYVTGGSVSRPLWWSAVAFSVLVAAGGIFALYYRGKTYNGKITKIASLDAFE
ncbi:MAG: hypothetical protein Q8R13_01505 [bacterium]|nr:hypothetical protein [bacterium]